LGGTSGGSAAASDHGLTPVPLIPDISAANIFGPDVRGPLTGGPGGIDDSILFPTPGDSIVPPFVPGADLPPSGHPPVVGSNPPVVAPPEVNPPDLIPPGVAPLIPPSASKPVHKVPEPDALLLFGTGLAIAGWKLRSRR
jgi:hypothetical protein